LLFEERISPALKVFCKEYLSIFILIWGGKNSKGIRADNLYNILLVRSADSMLLTPYLEPISNIR
jgi:hypothetical protein